MAETSETRTPLLIDTNIFLDYLLSEKHRRASEEMLKRVDGGQLTGYVLKFSLHSIEILLTARHQQAILQTFLEEVQNARGLTVYFTDIIEEQAAIRFTTRFSLDFDDALHCSIAKALNLTLVSFDHDFDRTDIQRKTPSDILRSFR